MRRMGFSNSQRMFARRSLPVRRAFLRRSGPLEAGLSVLSSAIALIGHADEFAPGRFQRKYGNSCRKCASANYSGINVPPCAVKCLKYKNIWNQAHLTRNQRIGPSSVTTEIPAPLCDCSWRRLDKSHTRLAWHAPDPAKRRRRCADKFDRLMVSRQALALMTDNHGKSLSHFNAFSLSP